MTWAKASRNPFIETWQERGPMYQLYTANKNYSSWSLRPWVLMKALAIPFEERLTVFDDDPAVNRAAFRKFSPSGKVPCLKDGDWAVWDSLAIAEYLAERHGGVWPADAKARAFARSAAAEMHSGFASLRNICGMNCGLRVKLREVPPPLAADIARLAEIWNDGLSRFGGPFLAGADFTAVDAFFCPVAYRVQTYGLPLDAACLAYVRRLVDHPAMQEWYRGALAETTRIARYEADARAVGEITADFRAV
jgi:glutathione S-transferase